MRNLLIASSIVLLAGCSTTHETYEQPEQYCYTDQTIVNDDGEVSSTTVLQCTDKPKVNHLNRDIGVAGMCRSYQKPVTRPNGDTLVIKGMMCRDKISGSWVSVNPKYSY